MRLWQLGQLGQTAAAMETEVYNWGTKEHGQGSTLRADAFAKMDN